jgi:2-oxo-4-hydroxy-4-carboxy--5-ureidoimidazoline (OHCU) decarboxylase
MAEAPSPSLPPVPSILSLPTASQSEILGLLFEPSPTLTTRFTPLLASQTFSSYDALIADVGINLRKLADSNDAVDQTALEDILSSHPRLGEKKVHSALSRMEQKAMESASRGAAGDDAAKEKEQEILRGLNEEYERTFPGLRYVCVAWTPGVDCTYCKQGVCEWEITACDFRRYAAAD